MKSNFPENSNDSLHKKSDNIPQEKSVKNKKNLREKSAKIQKNFREKKSILYKESDFDSANFREKVYEIVAQIPRGRVMTYGDIAAFCGSAHAARIVGGVAHFGDPNLPWQRVVNRFGGLARGYYGGRRQQKIDLEKEGIKIDENFCVVNFEKLRWNPFLENEILREKSIKNLENRNNNRHSKRNEESQNLKSKSLGKNRNSARETNAQNFAKKNRKNDFAQNICSGFTEKKLNFSTEISRELKSQKSEKIGKNCAKNLPLVVIVGATASGKTSLAVELAREFGGEIICADSRTIYREMNVGTAKPTRAEMCGIPHFGLDLILPNEKFTVADFQKYAEQKIAEIRARGKIPFLVGGSGLYIDGVIFGYEFGAKSDEKLREKLNKTSVQELQKYCKIHNILPENFKNKRYLMRAIEKFNGEKFTTINEKKLQNFRGENMQNNSDSDFSKLKIFQKNEDFRAKNLIKNSQNLKKSRENSGENFAVIRQFLQKFRAENSKKNPENLEKDLQKSDKKLRENTLIFGIEIDKKILRRKIKKRILKMFEDGIEDETRELFTKFAPRDFEKKYKKIVQNFAEKNDENFEKNRGKIDVKKSTKINENDKIQREKLLKNLFKQLPESLKGNIYWVIWREINGEIEPQAAASRAREKAINLAETSDWHLAKKQMTWFRRNAEIRWLARDEIAENLREKLR